MQSVLPWALEDWLTDEGDRVVRRLAAKLPISASDALLYEFWLFDTEQRNGGVSQYFANNGLKHWQEVCRLASPTMPSFSAFAVKLNGVVGDADDPYQAVTESEVDLDDWYRRNQLALVTELRSAVEPAT